MNLYAVTYLLCLGSIVPSVFGANILGLFPYPGKSHFYFFRPLLVGLAKAGHDVTVLSYFPSKEPIANYTDIVFDELPVVEDIVDLKEIEQVHFWLREFKLGSFFVLNQMGFQYCESAFDSPVMKTLLQSTKKFDVVLTEYFVNDCMLVVSHMLNAPVVGLTSHAPMPWHYKRMGSPFISSFMPNHFLSHSDDMGFFERLNNVVHQKVMSFLHEYVCQPQTNKMIKKHFGNTIPPIEDLVMNTSALLINQHYSLNGAAPYAPGVVEIAGLHIQEPKPLDAELKNVLDNARNGVIYVSWGSLVRPETLPSSKKEALITALSRFDQQLILLKWPNASIPNVPKNFYVRDWMPQREILCHPNVKVFMTHGGLLGSSEGCHCGVAIVVTPFFGDQFLNAEAINARNSGVVLHYRELQEENIIKAIQAALSPRMQERAKFVSEAFRNRPQTPLELSIWWVENVIRTKGSTLVINSSARMNWFVYHHLDIYTAVVLLSVFIFMIYYDKRLGKMFYVSKAPLAIPASTLFVMVCFIMLSFWLQVAYA